MPESRWFCCTWMMVGFGKKTTVVENGVGNATSTITVNNNNNEEFIDERFISSKNLAERLLSVNDDDNNRTTVGGERCYDDNDDVRSIFILDCRSATDFETMHIVNSIHVTLPTILQRRLIKGTLSVCSVISAKDLREQFNQVYKNALVVLIDDNKCHEENNMMCLKDVIIENDAVSSNNNVDLPLSYLLFKKLREDGCRAKLFEGTVTKFAQEYPCLCKVLSTDHRSADTCDQINERPSTLCYLDIKNMKLDDTCAADSPSSSLSSSCAASLSSGDSCCASSPEDHPAPSILTTTDVVSSSRRPPVEGSVGTPRYDEGFEPSSYSQRHQFQNGTVPAQIKPFLFLGNSINSSDLDMLEKYNIKYILNVTPNLPNVFENDNRFHYLKIPIDDHWSQNLVDHFPQAISFIDEARSQQCGVLVHCLAGISRSVTVIVAYLMYTFSMNLEDAYDLVKSHKPNIAPNLNFMGQLLDFQRHLFGGNPPESVHRHLSSPVVSPILRSDETFLTTPLSAPPRRAIRRTKQTTECF